MEGGGGRGRAASGLATWPGANPAGYEVSLAVAVWQKGHEEKETCREGRLTGSRPGDRLRGQARFRPEKKWRPRRPDGTFLGFGSAWREAVFSV